MLVHTCIKNSHIVVVLIFAQFVLKSIRFIKLIYYAEKLLTQKQNKKLNFFQMSTRLVKKLTKPRSALQLKVLGMYAQFVRLSKDQPGLLEKARHEFRAASDLTPKNDSLLIDAKLRRAKNQLAMLQTSHVKAVKVFSVFRPPNDST